MILLTTLAAAGVIAYRLSLRWWPRASNEAPGPFERTSMALLILSGLWLATTWTLALTGMLGEVALLTRAVMFAIVAVVTAWPARVAFGHIRSTHVPPRAAALVLLVLPLFAWTDFALWRGSVIPPVSHDALSYHLPKAVLFARSETFRHLQELEARSRSLPVNYELILAEIIVTTRSDRHTEWPGVFFYLAFVASCGALAERWGARRSVAFGAAMFAAGVPVVLLHSVAHKNDVMFAFFATMMFVSAGRWLRSADQRALMALIVATALALGTKPQAAIVAVVLAPFVLLHFFRVVPSGRMRRLAVLAGSGVAAFLLLGGVFYVTNFVNADRGSPQMNEAQVVYGDWRNLWEAPWVLLSAPFARDAKSLHVPWETKPWFWERYELYFSHLGIPFSLAAVALAVLLALRRGAANRERRIIVFAAFAAFVAILPVIFHPHGMYAISLPRYVLFLVPVVFAGLATLLPERAVPMFIGVAIVSFLGYAVDAARNDAFAPLDYVLWAAANRDTRVVPFDNGRAASVVDRMAAPDAKIALDAGYATWIHPAYGRDLTREVFLIPPGTGVPEIPPDADWVAIDRSWSIGWEAPGLTDLSDGALRMRGSPSPEELRVRRHLVRNPEFKLEYVRLGSNQLVFRRIRQPVQ